MHTYLDTYVDRNDPCSDVVYNPRDIRGFRGTGIIDAGLTSLL